MPERQLAPASLLPLVGCVIAADQRATAPVQVRFRGHLQQASLVDEQGCLDAVIAFELEQDMTHVGLYGALGDKQILADGGVGKAPSD